MKTAAQKVVALAAAHADEAAMVDSAHLCLDDARELLAGGDEVAAARRALSSLKYSVGILSPIYAEAQALAAVVS